MTCADGTAEEDDDKYTIARYSGDADEQSFSTKRFNRTFASAATLHINVRTTSAGTPNVEALDANASGYLKAKRIA